MITGNVQMHPYSKWKKRGRYISNELSNWIWEGLPLKEAIDPLEERNYLYSLLMANYICSSKFSLPLSLERGCNNFLLHVQWLSSPKIKSHIQTSDANHFLCLRGAGLEMVALFWLRGLFVRSPTETRYVFSALLFSNQTILK